MNNEQLKTTVERVERLETIITETREDIKSVYAEAKGNGFDVPALKKIISERKQDQDKLNELEAFVEAYKTALGEK